MESFGLPRSDVKFDDLTPSTHRTRRCFILRERRVWSRSEDDPSRVLCMSMLNCNWWGFNNGTINASQEVVIKEVDVFEGPCIRAGFS